MSATLDHDFFVYLFRERPQLATELLRRIGHSIPGEQAELASIDLSQVAPIEYRADAMIVLRAASGIPTYAIVVEVQTTIDRRKEYTWPVYLTVARANLRCPVTLLVIATELAVAQWARRPTYLGGGFNFTPNVLTLDDVPDAVDEDTARRIPELLLLAAIAHPSERLVLAAYEAIRSLHEEVSKVYLDKLQLSLPEALQELLMDMKNYEYQSDFARKYISQGREEGREEGRVAMLRDLLAAKFGPLPESVEVQLRECGAARHRAIIERTLTATSLDEVLALLASG